MKNRTANALATWKRWLNTYRESPFYHLTIYVAICSSLSLGFDFQHDAIGVGPWALIVATIVQIDGWLMVITMLNQWNMYRKKAKLLDEYLEDTVKQKLSTYVPTRKPFINIP